MALSDFHPNLEIGEKLPFLRHELKSLQQNFKRKHVLSQKESDAHF